MPHPLSGARIAFDLDGTLVDTAPDLVRALNAAVVPMGLREVPLDAVRAMVGRGAKALIVKAFERAERSVEEAAVEDALAAFLDAYAADLSARSRVFDGALAALDALAEAGAHLSVCTNKPGHLARPLLDQLDLSWRFERVVGPEDAPAKKPDPAHLLTAFGGRPEGFSALVGDSEPDVLAAKAAGASSLIFEGGYSEKPVRDLGADRLFGHFSDLLAALETERASR